jgi:O-antigen/teichoic acid export membrane protein
VVGGRVMTRLRAWASSYVVLRFTQYGLLFLNGVLVSRALGPAGRARYVLPLVLSATVFALLHLSVETAAGRLVGRREATPAEVTRVLAALLLLTGIVGAGVVLAVGALGRESLLAGAKMSTVVVAAAAVLAQAMQSAGYILLILGALRHYAAIVATSAAVQVLFVVGLLAFSKMTPTLAALAALLGFTWSSVLMMLSVGSRLGFRALIPAPSREHVRLLMHAAIRMHPLSLALELGPRIDLLIVGALATPRQAGEYSLALTLSDGALLASWTASSAAIAQVAANTREAAIYFVRSFTARNVRLACGAAVVGSLLAYPIVVQLYGPSWKGAVVPIIILIGASIATTAEDPARLLLMRLWRPELLSGVAVVGVAINVVATIALFHVLGLAGAALASVLAYWIYALAVLAIFGRVAGVHAITLRTLTGLRRGT